MIVGEHKFHPECFRCTVCQQFIGDGDLYALVERSKLFWYVRTYLTLSNVIAICIATPNFVSYSIEISFSSGNCYRQQIDTVDGSVQRQINSPTSLSDILNPSTSTKGLTTQKTLPHSIRLIELPWCNENKTTIQLSIDDSRNVPTVEMNSNKTTGVRITQ